MKASDARPALIFVNALTVAAAWCGAASLYLAHIQEFSWSAAAILTAGVLDTLDGRMARRFQAATPFGVQLDSLADFLNFGVCPAFLVAVIHEDAATAVASMIFGSAALLRLARFNITSGAIPERQAATVAIGLPSTAAGGFIALATFFEEVTPWQTAVFQLALAALMVSRLRFPTLAGLANRVSS
jgi:CDP-diacylglycerol--serine O-phosphatidyltransferase